ncbi:MAG: hypothetical protein IKJ73_10965 [Lachnospiraceae bacterium]|nr:hypothetical protein [Lachnospiraceae bacterium]
MRLYDKGEVIDYIWQYSRFYGNKLGECERYFADGEGHTAIILLFEITENICKSVVGDYESSFYKIVCKLMEKGVITADEEVFLSSGENSVRNIRNLFAHANLMTINIVNVEDEQEILYPLTEEDSCLLLYEKISYLLFNMLLKIVVIGKINIELEFDFGEILKAFELRIRKLTSSEMLRYLGLNQNTIESMKALVDEKDLQRLADNSSNVNVLKAIFEKIKG